MTLPGVPLFDYPGVRGQKAGNMSRGAAAEGRAPLARILAWFDGSRRVLGGRESVVNGRLGALQLLLLALLAPAGELITSHALPDRRAEEGARQPNQRREPRERGGGCPGEPDGLGTRCDCPEVPGQV